MEYTEEELSLEFTEDQQITINLASSVTTCMVCDSGKVVTVGRGTTLVLYTRNGTKKAVHTEMRCNDQRCRVGYYYGFYKKGSSKYVDDDALRNEYLITSTQSGFAIDYLWDVTLQILFSNATFESLGNIYNNLHFTCLPFDMMQKREAVIAKRISEAFYLYSFIELGQRYNIEVSVASNLDEAVLEKQSVFQNKFRSIWTQNHSCTAPGCGSVITVDGGLKPHRKLCGAKLAGIREFKSTGLSVVTGCTSIPGPRSKFCKEHQLSQSPALLSEQLPQTTRKKLRDHRTREAESTDAPQDNVYVIESILDRRSKKGTSDFLIKWLGFPPSEATWESENSVPKFIQDFYAKESNFGKVLPNPKIKMVKKAGSAVYHLLSWDDETSVAQWVNEDFFNLLREDGELMSMVADNSCNTRKSRDKASYIINFFPNSKNL